MREELEIKKMMEVWDKAEKGVSPIIVKFATSLAKGEKPDVCTLVYYLFLAYENIVGEENELLYKLYRACKYLKEGKKVTIEPP